MSTYYYEFNGIRICWTTKMRWRCKCKTYDDGRVLIHQNVKFSEMKNVEGVLIQTTIKTWDYAVLGTGKGVRCQDCKEMIDKRYVVYVEDCRNAKIHGGLFRTGSKIVKTFHPSSRHYRDKLVRELRPLVMAKKFKAIERY